MRRIAHGLDATRADHYGRIMEAKAMAQSRGYKRFAGKTIREIDSTVSPSGEVFIGLRFRDGTELNFAIHQRPVLEAYRGEPRGKRKRSKLRLEWRNQDGEMASA